MSVRIILITFLSLFLCITIHAQSIQPYFYQYNTDDGLPSSETYYLLQDRSGYIWIATDNGIARFDGHRFQVFGQEQGLEDEVVFKIHEDNSGRIWVSTYSGALYYFTNEHFHAYIHNDVLQTLKKSLHLVTLEDLSYPDGLLFMVRHKGLFYLDEAGNVHWLTEDIGNAVFLYENKVTGNLTVFHKRKNGESPVAILEYDAICNSWEQIAVIEERFATITRGIKDQEQTLLVGPGSFLSLSVNQITHTNNTIFDHLPYSLSDHQGGYFFCADDGGGLQNYQLTPSGEIQKKRTLLPGHSIAFGLYDRQGGLWVCSRDAGLFYAPHPQIARFAQEQALSSAKVRAIALVGDTVFFAGYSDGSIFHHNYKQDKSLPLFPPGIKQSYEVSSLYYDSKKRCLYTNEFCYSYTNNTVLPAIALKKHYLVDGEILSKVREFHQLSVHDDRQLLFHKEGALGIYDLDKQRARLTYVSRLFKHLTCHAHCQDQSGRYWVGTLHGLLEFHENKGVFSEEDLGHTTLRKRVEEILRLPNGALLLGTRGSGLVYYHSDTTYLIDKENGLVANDIRKLHLAQDSSVWVATLQGISKLRFDQYGKLQLLQSYNRGHGLASEEIYDIDTNGKDVWLVSGRGIIRFWTPTIQQPSPYPIVERLTVNGQESYENTESDIRLSPTENNLSIQFKTINYRMLGRIAYRYRNYADTPWQLTEQNQVNYANLPSGQYRFEVQSENEDGLWSESSMLHFEVEAPWYQHWASQLAMLLFLICVFGFFFVQRDRRRSKEQRYQRQVDNLERAALNAQMNPHFIFNSLTSIQNFILLNERKAAVIYLSRFAHLIRNTLNVSMRRIHSLSEELKLINHYLELESLRFENGFSYRVEVADHLASEQILLPPLLIQPFIENAIKHGLKDRSSGGEVEVVFKGTSNLLEVCIKDNGIGFDPTKELNTDSAGMNITRRRLELMQHQHTNAPVIKIEIRRDPEEQIIGTEIIIFITTQQKELVPLVE